MFTFPIMRKDLLAQGEGDFSILTKIKENNWKLTKIELIMLLIRNYKMIIKNLMNKSVKLLPI
jgi:hypothetical protein